MDSVSGGLFDDPFQAHGHERQAGNLEHRVGHVRGVETDDKVTEESGGGHQPPVRPREPRHSTEALAPGDDLDRVPVCDTQRLSVVLVELAGFVTARDR